MQVKDPYSTDAKLVRMSWHQKNLENLLTAKLPDLSRLTVYQQKWKAKKYLRGYHVPNINERQFLDRHFQTLLPIKLHDKKDRENLPPIQSIMFGELERRVDVVVFRSLFASSIWNARQMVVHGHVKVNGEQCRYPARRLEDGDMITVNPNVMATLAAPGEGEHAPRKWTPVDYMSPWMFIPTYLEVCFATCSAIFLRSPLVQPKRMEIPSPYPPNWHQLVYEWYAQKKKAQKRAPPKPQLVINGQSVKLKPKFDRIVRADQYQLRSKIESIKSEDRKLATRREKLQFQKAGHSL
ncbi:mitochondrial 37S ribosomal protein nam9 [Kappamyces sp. JEL0680]|nr:mitochondrial 37S ribosomal protein nam9 [Kappamyces sp. JEL0680]